MKKSLSNFPVNLRLACNQYATLTDVCRSLGINRQQFNKYLAGQVSPSRRNMQRICDFFEIEEQQFALKQADFKILLSGKGSGESDASAYPIDQTISMLPNDVMAMARYEGYYHTYFNSVGYPGGIIRNLMCIYRVRERFYTKIIEHLWDKEKNEGSCYRPRFKYKGIALYLSDRVFITEHEYLAGNTICHTVLVPNYSNTLQILSGLTMNVSSRGSRMPKASRIEYHYLGRSIDLREALRECGLFDASSDSVSPEIRARIDNQILPHEYTLTARAY